MDADTLSASQIGAYLDFTLLTSFLPARRYASAVFATATCLSVRLSVRHTPVLCLAERKQDREMCTVWYPHDSSFWQGMSRRKIRKGSPERNMPNEGWVGFSAILDQCVVIFRKRCILDTKLLWDGNRKPYASYRMVSLSMTLSDPWPGFQGHGSFKRRVSPKRRILQTQLLYWTLIGNHIGKLSIGKLAIQLTTPLLLRKPCKRFASVARVCQRQLAFLVLAGQTVA